MKSVLVELWYILSVFFPFLVASIVLKTVFSDPLRTNFECTDLLFILPFGIMMVALFNKDIFNGQSVVHRLLGYQVMDANTRQSASKVKCMLRNITAPIWLVEVPFILISPKKRLGDLIAGTVLIDIEASDPESILIEIKESKFDRQTKLSLFTSIAIVTLLLLLSNPWKGI